MSIQDALLVLSDEQDLNATADSENTIDFGTGEDAFGTALTDPEFGEGRPMYINVQVGDTALDSAGEAATLTVTLYTSTDDSSFSAAAVLASSVAEASLVAGYRIASVPIPAGLSRYNKLTYTVGTEDFISGNINAWIGLEPIVVV